MTGNVYEAEEEGPEVTLFTKEGCTLCDKVKDMLKDLQKEIHHSLVQIDITVEEHKEWFDRYKYDIRHPCSACQWKILVKHRTALEEARSGLLDARDGNFDPRQGEPNVAAMERKDKEARGRSS